MSYTHKASIIEKIAERLKIIPDLHQVEEELAPLEPPGDLTNYPPPDQWNHWTEYEATQWSKKVKKDYSIVPTTCFNCESACGLLAYIDKENGQVRKFEGNPYHPGSRGRNCAKGPATINQITDPDRILYPLKRKGKRGDGEWERVTWDEVLDDIAGRIRNALKEKRNNEIAYHVGRPGHEGYMDRVLKAWGVDGHNSHTNVCSSGARFGYNLWQGYDRPSPDYANARFILLISAHLESGHYFNPHAQRIMEGMMGGAQLAVIDPRLSNTASMADHWMPAYPGTEAAMLLAMVKVILDEGLFNREFVQQWVNWQEYLEKEHPDTTVDFDHFIQKLKEEYKDYTPEFAEKESGVDAEQVRTVARLAAAAGTKFATHNWRSAGSGNLGGWAVARCLHFLSVLTGSVGTVGGTLPSGWNKFKPQFFATPPGPKFWNELHYPKEYPLAFHEMSILLPYFLKEGRGKLDVYFTRVFNPVWTYPDGFSWIEALSDESKVGLHIAMTPTWNETAYFADYVLPMGHASERHDLNSYETHGGTWIAFRQPVLREFAAREGKPIEHTYEANPGEVWEEDEFWIELSWRIDPTGELGIKPYFESPYRKGEKVSIDEYYQYIFERTPGLPEKAAEEGLNPLEYMRKYGAFEVEKHSYNKHLNRKEVDGATRNERGQYERDGQVVAHDHGNLPVEGFRSPSRKQELYSQTMVDWKWPEYRLPAYIKSHVHEEKMDREAGDFPLVPTFRLPVLIHSRSGNAKWLTEIANRNPIWIHTSDAARFGLNTGDLVRINTDIGYFVDKVWVTEGMKPGVLACSHHLGRWRRPQDKVGNRWATNLVEIESRDGKWRMNLKQGIEPSKSNDRDTSRIFWSDGGVHQNITFPVHPDPISGMHCWHQKVRLEPAHAEDQYGDIQVDTNKSYQVYKEWMSLARPAPGPDNLRRPLWFTRVLRPTEETFYLSE